MKKKLILPKWHDVMLIILFILAVITFIFTVILMTKSCSTDPVYADDKQTVEMIHYQQQQGRFAIIEEDGYINILK